MTGLVDLPMRGLGSGVDSLCINFVELGCLLSIVGLGSLTGSEVRGDSAQSCVFYVFC